MTNDQFDLFVDNAIRWAKTRLNSTEYPFRCLSFVEDAYEQGNQVEIFGGRSAKESADEYEAWKNTAPIPLGAFVFYDCSGPLKGEYKNWGHVGLSIGHGDVIHAWDSVRIDNYLEIQNLTPGPGWTKPRYTGWAPVERIFQGHCTRT